MKERRVKRRSGMTTPRQAMLRPTAHLRGRLLRYVYKKTLLEAQQIGPIIG